MYWTQFDREIDADTIAKLNELEEGKSSYEPVDYGKYEVVPEKIELTTSKNGNPMTVIWLRIVSGEHKNAIIFANFVMKSAYGIHKVKEFVRSLNPETEVKFECFSQWDECLQAVSDEVCGQMSYVLNYEGETTKKGDVFDRYTIEDGAFEVPDDYKFRN